MKQHEKVDDPRALAAGQGADLAAFYDRRAAAALAYCSRLCAPDAIAEAVEASFARVFEAAASSGELSEDGLDRRLRSAVRTEAAARASSAAAGMPARRLLERLADPNRGGACELMPALLAARADGVLSDGDVDRMQQHLRRCAECRTAEARFDEAEQAFDALATDDAPALGRSLLAEMLTDAPLGERRRFTRERLAAADWLEEIEWEDADADRPPEPTVVQVPADALDFGEGGTGNGEPVEEDETFVAEEPEPEPRREPPRRTVVLRDPAITSADTVDFPAPRQSRRPRLGARARRRLAVAMLVIGAVLFAEAGLTVFWKEPVTAFMTARAQDDLTEQLEKRGPDELDDADSRRLAGIEDDEERARERMALLAERERTSVPEGDAVGLLRMKSIDVETVVVRGTEAATLRKGPGHYDATKLPGEGGPVGIAGHRTTYDGPFRKLDELERGDRITLKMPYGLFTYEVERDRIVPADFKGAFDSDLDQLVLSACHPLYSASERILVYARLVDSVPLGPALEGEDGEAAPTERELAERRKARRLEVLGDRQLFEGMSGPDVKELQRLLGLPQTGTFGPETTAAVIEFQRTHGLPPVGQVGSQTKEALARRPRPPSRPPTPPPVPQQQQPGQQPYGQQPNPDGSVPPAQGYTPPGTTPQSGTGAQSQQGAAPPDGSR